MNASHLKGGWIFYEYLGKGSAPNTSKYRITVNQYLLCSSSGLQIDANVFLGIFNGASYQLVQDDTIPRTTTVFEKKISFDPCINNPPQICYRIDKYVTVVELNDNNAGYVLAVQRCCRIGGIVNINNSSFVGVTYTTRIPGIVQGLVVRNNNSPIFAQKDTAIVCVNSSFSFDFSATDADGDSLSYVFCDGLTGGDNSASGTQPNPPNNPPPPFVSLNYAAGYTGQTPMGAGVTIDANTGIISGTAPGTTGDYVVAVCAIEFRNGINIGQTKKEIHINVSNCQLAGAQLKPVYITCNGFSFTFQNESSASNIISYHWDFGVQGINTDTSSLPVPTYTFPDTGRYAIKLSVQNIAGCKDSAASILKVFPGFFPGFISSGSCFLSPFQFNDTSKTNYGNINSWRWDFGDLSSTKDTSTKQNTAYTYPVAGAYTVSLTVTNNKGCIDTAYANIIAYNKPSVSLPFHDTLICSGDTVQLHAATNAVSPVFSWLPVVNIDNPQIPDPKVYPNITTTYVLNIDDKGCKNADSVKINVVKAITANILSPDTALCSTDTLQLNTSTTAIAPVYSWSPPVNISNPNIANPVVYPQTSTTYTMHVKDQVCNAADSIKISVVKAITANILSPDTTLCSTDTLQLNTSTTAIAPVYSWSPPVNINNPNIATPLVYPQTPTTYTMHVKDQVCNAADSIKISVVKAITAKVLLPDTTLCSTDTLQLNASSTAIAPVYIWSPPINISNINIANPLVYPQASTTYILHVNDQVCNAVDSIKIDVVKAITANIITPDTTICLNDSLQLNTASTALFPVYTWLPASYINNTGIGNPLVYPKDSTTYILKVVDRVCAALDSVRINVVQSLAINMGADTSICRGDTIYLNPSSNGTQFVWTPSSGLSNPLIRNPLAFPVNTTHYQLSGSVGKCQLAGSITIKVGPYPQAFAGPDTMVCYGYTTQLHANISGSQFTWFPVNSLLNPSSLMPYAGPQQTTTYLLVVHDTSGCPKAAIDSITVKVIPPVKAYAGHDTSIVVNQPLQLSASGGDTYLWSPFTGMNDPAIPNPIVILGSNIDYIIYRVKVGVPGDCYGYDDIKVTVYKTLPEIFIPTGFTPNGDGLNDILKPILAGIKQLQFFRIFNRWGQMIFSTSEPGRGWDGTFGGAKQPAGTYVVEASAIDYLGNKIVKRGTFVLIR